MPRRRRGSWRRRRGRLGLVAVLLVAVLLVAGCGGSGPTATTTLPPSVVPPAPTVVANSHTQVGVLSVIPYGGDGGQTALVNGQVLWIFGDTFFYTNAPDGSSSRSATAALASPQTPLLARSLVGSDGFPTQVIPYTAEEAAYNAAGTNGSHRWALWPSGIVPQPDGSALIFYLHLRIPGGGQPWDGQGVGVARLRPGASVAERLPQLLFSASEPSFQTVVIRGDTVNLLACAADHCKVARAPLAHVAERDAYTFWDGAQWQAEFSRATASIPGSTNGFSIEWNAQRQEYVSVSDSFFNLDVQIRVARQIEGPWSDPTVAFQEQPQYGPGAVNPDGTPKKSAPDYGVTLHPELSPDGGRTLYVTYFRPTEPFRGEIRADEVALA